MENKIRDLGDPPPPLGTTKLNTCLIFTHQNNTKQMNNEIRKAKNEEKKEENEMKRGKKENEKKKENKKKKRGKGYHLPGDDEDDILPVLL